MAQMQVPPEQQRILDCYPHHGMGEPVTYTEEHLRCLEAELQRQIPISFEIVPGADATGILATTRGQSRTRFVIGNLEEVFRLFETFSFNARSAGEILEAAAHTDPKTWLKAAAPTQVDDGREDIGVHTGPLPPDLELLRTQLPPSVAVARDAAEAFSTAEHILAVRDPRGLKPEVVIATLEEPDWTNVPAFLRYGGWNACPPPEVHVALHRYWREHYGIELLSARIDALEFRVANPPRDREAALALAREQYAYCNDVVDQGVGTLAELAAALMDSDYWFFWWD